MKSKDKETSKRQIETIVNECLTNENLLRHFIDTLTDYDVVTSEIVNDEDGKKVYGLFCPSEKKIYINPHQDNTERKCTLIHEFVHNYGRKHNLPLNEKQVMQIERQMYKKLYGG